MNERIKQLAEQAGMGHERWNTTSQFESFLEKFAELIVRECMDVVRDISQEYDGGSTVVNAADEIKEHFGVEE